MDSEHNNYLFSASKAICCLLIIVIFTGLALQYAAAYFFPSQFSPPASSRGEKYDNLLLPSIATFIDFYLLYLTLGIKFISLRISNERQSADISIRQVKSLFREELRSIPLSKINKVEYHYLPDKSVETESFLRHQPTVLMLWLDDGEKVNVGSVAGENYETAQRIAREIGAKYQYHYAHSKPNFISNLLNLNKPSSVKWKKPKSP